MQVNMEDSKKEVQKQITLEVSTRVKVLSYQQPWCRVSPQAGWVGGG